MPAKLITTAVFDIDAFPAVFPLVFFPITSVIISAPRAFYKGTEYVWLISALSVHFGYRYTPDLLELL